MFGRCYCREIDGSIEINHEADLQFDCPRCGTAVSERFYGPCQGCRDQLRATQANEQSDVEAPEYEPKMNVTPNAVATKE